MSVIKRRDKWTLKVHWRFWKHSYDSKIYIHKCRSKTYWSGLVSRNSEKEMPSRAAQVSSGCMTEPWAGGDRSMQWCSTGRAHTQRSTFLSMHIWHRFTKDSRQLEREQKRTWVHSPWQWERQKFREACDQQKVPDVRAGTSVQVVWQQ